LTAINLFLPPAKRRAKMRDRYSLKISGASKMFKTITRAVSAAALVLGLAAFSQPAFAGEGMVVKQSPYGVAETLDRLERVLKKKGITVFARVDHAAGAKKVGMELAATQVLIFGNPKIGTPLMQSNRRIAIDLPMKALAWMGKDGKVRLAYNAAPYLSQRHGITDRAKVFQKMAGALDKLTNAALKK